MPFDSLPAWLHWLEQCHPREIDLGLDRIKRVAAQLDLLSPSATVITVAGTNGKGSCVTATAALLRAAGHSVGVYTSPHLLNYNERIVVDGKPVSDDDICVAFAAIYSACQQARTDNNEAISLTYFEYGTLAALEIFRRYQVSAMVLEVGLGGRLDAVNIIDADIAVITSIAIDHQDWLGDNREKIGFEKAGIMRADRVAICADHNPPESVINHAARIGAQLQLIDRDFGYQINDDHWSWWNNQTHFDDQPLPHLPLPSLAAALQVVSILNISLVTIDAFNCLSALRVAGRFQTLVWQERILILDVAHNPAATAYLAQRLVRFESNTTSDNTNTCATKTHAARTHGIVAMMADKDRVESLRNLLGLVDHWYLADLRTVARAAGVAQLRHDLQELGVDDDFSGNVEECLNYALASSRPGDKIIIFGSFFTVAAGLQAIAS